MSEAAVIDYTNLVDDVHRGRYIVVEGADGAGKSSQARLLAGELGGVFTFEPGGDDYGQRVREVLLDPDSKRINPMTDVLMFASQRAELATTTINPTVNRGIHVVSDRSWISSAAYQSVEGGVDVEVIKDVNVLALGRLIRPDLVLLLDGDPAILKDRLGAKKDYFEQKGIEFQYKIRHAFKDIAIDVGAVVINAEQPFEEVTAQIREAVHDRLSL